MAKSNLYSKLTENIDEPFDVPESWNFLKKNKIRIMLIFEDQSFKEYFVKLKDDYVFTIKGKKYILLPLALLQGKNPTFLYYFNNPMPVHCLYTETKIKSQDLYEKESYNKLSTDLKHTLANTMLDAKTLNVAFTSNLINKMYSENRFLTPKNIIIILVVVFVMLIIILHFTGVIDIMTLLGVKK